VPSGLLSPSFWAVQKKHLTKKNHSAKPLLCRVSSGLLGPIFWRCKKTLDKKNHSAKPLLCRVSKKRLGKDLFYRVQKKTLPSVFLTQGKQLFKIHILMHKMTSNERVFKYKVVTLLKTYKVYFDRFFI
jgi:hypothetical protein